MDIAYCYQDWAGWDTSLWQRLVSDKILLSILQQQQQQPLFTLFCRRKRKEEKRNKLAELHLTETQISKLCVPNIIGLGKLKCIAVPPEDVCGFSERHTGNCERLPIPDNTGLSRGLLFCRRGDHRDCQQQLPTQRPNHPLCIYWWQHVCLLLIAYNEPETYYLCARQALHKVCVNRTKSRKPSLDICWKVNHTP